MQIIKAEGYGVDGMNVGKGYTGVLCTVFILSTILYI